MAQPSKMSLACQKWIQDARLRLGVRARSEFAKNGIALDRGICLSQAIQHSMSFNAGGRQPTPNGELPAIRVSYVQLSWEGRYLLAPAHPWPPCRGSRQPLR